MASEVKMTATGYKAPSETARKKAMAKKVLLNLSPIFALLLVVIFFFAVVNKEGIRIDAAMEVVINKGIIVAVVATGATMIFTLGSFDISLGAAVCVNCMVTTLVYISTQNLPLAILVSVLFGVVICLLESGLSSVLKIPVFVTTIASMNILQAISLLLDGKYNKKWSYSSIHPEAYNYLKNIGSHTVLSVVILIVFVILCFVVFDLMKEGRRAKFAGGNMVCAKLSGVRMNRLTIIAFAISGLGVAIAAFLTISYSPEVSTSTASSVGMDILVAIVFGGMPISGGPKSKIYAAIVGAFTMAFLKRGLYYLGYSEGAQQMILAVLFIVVVYITCLGYKSKQLTR